MATPQTASLDENVKQCVGCDAVGLPEKGYRFYVCTECLDLFGKLLDGFDAPTPRSGLVS